MPVRPTESRIPNGLQIKDLGQADENGNFKLVSYLTHPLRYEEGEKPLENTYVVFDTGSTSEPADYRWKFEFKVEGEVDPIEFADLVGVEGGAVFNLNSEEDVFEDELEGKKIKKIKVTVAIDANATILLRLEQKVESLKGEIEELIKSAEMDNGAIAGDPKTTRILGNDYRDYLLELEKSIGETGIKEISINLIAALLYQKIEEGNSNQPDLEKWIDYVNGVEGSTLDDLIGTKIGWLRVKPHVFHFFTKDLAVDDSIENYVHDPNSSNMNKYEKGLLSQITDADEKKDLVNILRFPKSSIAASWKYLKNLKVRHATIKNNILDIEHHSDNKHCISTVVTEHETAPQKNDFDDFSSTAVQAFDMMYTEWMQAIIFKSEILMQSIKIKVLDIRSGNRLLSEKVRKIVVAETVPGLSNSFTYTDEVDNGLLNANEKRDLREYFRGCSIIPDDLPAVESAQRALFRMGYAPDESYQKTAILNTYALLENEWSDNDWGPNTSAAYNQYWQDRLLGSHTMDRGVNDDDKPRSFYLYEIKRDYNKISRTDDEGKLEIRIPKIFMDNKRVHVDIQFWLISIAREEIDSDSNDPISRDSEEENIPTQFIVSWTGGTGANQKIDWIDYVANNQYVESAEFGWEVSKEERNSKLKAVQRLIVKDDMDEFEELDSSLLSKFYDSDSYLYHFVMFGMVWCQPVWDGIDDPEASNTHKVGEEALVYGAESHAFNYVYAEGLGGRFNQNMHFVSRCLLQDAGEEYAKYYPIAGSAPWRVAGRHYGFDLHTVDGAPVFAIRGGLAYQANDPGGFNNYANVVWNNQRILYGHLRAAAPAFHPLLNGTDVNNRTPVPAGLVLGYTGPGGHGGNYPRHTHIEYKYNNNPENTGRLHNHPADDNRHCLPSNDLPIMYPCHCVVQNNSPANCNLNNLAFVNLCWTIEDLKCPFIIIRDANDNIIRTTIRLQVQLKYLHEKVDAHLYHDPGNIDNSLGNNAVNKAMVLNRNTVVNVTGNSSARGELIEIQYNAQNGWIERSLIDAGNRITEDLSNVLNNRIQNTRMAIYKLKKALGRLDYTDYASNYIMEDSDPTWDDLDRLSNVQEAP